MNGLSKLTQQLETNSDQLENFITNHRLRLKGKDDFTIEKKPETLWQRICYFVNKYLFKAYQSDKVASIIEKQVATLNETEKNKSRVAKTATIASKVLQQLHHCLDSGTDVRGGIELSSRNPRANSVNTFLASVTELLKDLQNIRSDNRDNNEAFDNLSLEMKTTNFGKSEFADSNTVKVLKSLSSEQIGYKAPSKSVDTAPDQEEQPSENAGVDHHGAIWEDTLGAVNTADSNPVATNSDKDEEVLDEGAASPEREPSTNPDHAAMWTDALSAINTGAINTSDLGNGAMETVASTQSLANSVSDAGTSPRTTLESSIDAYQPANKDVGKAPATRSESGSSTDSLGQGKKLGKIINNLINQLSDLEAEDAEQMIADLEAMRGHERTPKEKARLAEIQDWVASNNSSVRKEADDFVARGKPLLSESHQNSSDQ